MLGPLRVRCGNGWVPVAAPQQRVVLAMLLIDGGQVVSTERLVDAVWPGRPPRTAANTIAAYVLRLRRLVGAEMLATRGRGYALVVTDGDIDAVVFERHVDIARRELEGGRLEAAATRLGQALTLWQGPKPALADVPPGPWLEPRVTYLEQLRLSAAEEHSDVLLELGRHVEVADELHRMVSEQPLRERRWAQLMAALDRCGRRGEALEAYQRARRVLHAELGLEPGAQLRQLQQEILAGAPPPATTRPPAQLPADVSGFTGRAGQLAQLDATLPAGDQPGAAVAISTLVGTPGVGKTALAVHWAHRVRAAFPDGQLYVNLRGFDAGGSVTAPAEAVRGFLDALQVPAQRLPTGLDAQAALYRSLVAGRRMLLVLDNAHDADQVRPLLPGAPGCAVVVTSRNQLASLVAVDGAQPVTIDLLPAGEAAELLARRLGPDRVAAEPRAVDDIVTRCAGLPLALAIVAARAVTHPDFPLRALADELRHSHDRLDALTCGDPASDVRAVFSWSYRTLTAGAARLFRLLGLHPGPDISTAAAASLAGLPQPRTRTMLAELACAHLIVEHTPGRYTLHDLLRSYAAELARTGDPDDQRHAAIRRTLDHYLHTAHAAALLLNPQRVPCAGIASPQPGATPDDLADYDQAMAWFTAEQRVLLAAVNHAADAGLDTRAWQLAWTLADYLLRQGRWHEQAASQRAALAAAQRLGDPSAQARTHRLLARACARLRQFDEAHRHYQRALDLHCRSADRLGQAATHVNLANLLEQQGRYTEALNHAGQGLQLYRTLCNQPGQADALNGIGWCHAQLGDYQQALTSCRQALALNQEIGGHRGSAAAWDSLGYTHQHLGQHQQATTCYQQAVRLRHDLGDRYDEADTLIRLGDAHRAACDPAAARDAWLHALTILDELDHPDADPLRTRLSRPDEPGVRTEALTL